MQNVKESMEYLCKCLQFFNCHIPTLEQIRQSKQNNPDSLIDLKLTLANLILLQHSNFNLETQNKKIEVLNQDFVINQYFYQIDKIHFIVDINSSQNIMVLIAYVIYRSNFFEIYRKQSYLFYYQNYEQNVQEKHNFQQSEFKQTPIIETFNLIKLKLDRIEKLKEVLNKKQIYMKQNQISIDDLYTFQNEDAFLNKIERYKIFISYLESELNSQKHEQIFFSWMESIVTKLIESDEKLDFQYDNRENIIKEFNVEKNLENDINLLNNKLETFRPIFECFMSNWEFQSEIMQQNTEFMNYYKSNCQKILKRVNSKYIEFEQFKKIINDKYEANIILDNILEPLNTSNLTLKNFIDSNLQNEIQIKDNMEKINIIISQIENQVKKIVKIIK